MPKYGVTVTLKLRKRINVTAFNREQAEEYVWDNLVDEDGALIDDVDLFDYDVDDIDVRGYETL